LYAQYQEENSMNRECTILFCLIFCFSLSCGIGPQTDPTPSALSIEFTGEVTTLQERQTALPEILGTNSACQVTAIWSVCTDETFESYTLYRSVTPDISLNLAEAQLLNISTSSDDNSYVDNTVIGSTNYYYALKTTNIADMPSWSNEVSILTPSGAEPTPSILSDSTDAYSAYLWWTPCDDLDFTSYTLFRSVTPGIASDTLSATNLGVFDGSDFISHVDSLFYGISAFYSVRTRNDFGLDSWSNEVCAVYRDSSIVLWGYGDCDVPNPNYGFMDISAGDHFQVGLMSNGFVVAWGDNNMFGQCDVPEPNTDFVAVSCGVDHTLALKENGSIVAWGINNLGQCDVPDTGPFIALAAGVYHSLGLKEDGSIIAWGYNNYGQCDIPSPNSDFTAIAAGAHHCLGLKEDGSIIAWGKNSFSECDVPSPNTNFVAVTAGAFHSLGLKTDGSIVAWGRNNLGQGDIPSPNTDFVAIVAGENHSLGLKSDGSIVAWGSDNSGQCTLPVLNKDFIAIAAGENRSLGLRAKTAF